MPAARHLRGWGEQNNDDRPASASRQGEPPPLNSRAERGWEHMGLATFNERQRRPWPYPCTERCCSTQNDAPLSYPGRKEIILRGPATPSRRTQDRAARAGIEGSTRYLGRNSFGTLKAADALKGPTHPCAPVTRAGARVPSEEVHASRSATDVDVVYPDGGTAIPQSQPRGRRRGA
jgi:hypothetical protein